MNKFTDFFQFCVTGYFFLEQIFNRFDIMIGGFFDSLDPLGVGFGKIVYQRIQHLARLPAERWYFRYAGVGRQSLKPADFDFHAQTDQAVFAENRAQGEGFTGIAAVYGRNSG